MVAWSRQAVASRAAIVHRSFGTSSQRRTHATPQAGDRHKAVLGPTEHFRRAVAKSREYFRTAPSSTKVLIAARSEDIDRSPRVCLAAYGPSTNVTLTIAEYEPAYVLDGMERRKSGVKSKTPWPCAPL